MTPDPETGAGVGLEEARAAKARLVALLAAHPAVNGIGIAPRPGGYDVKVNLVTARPADLRIPERIGRVGVRVEVVGPIVRR